MTCWLKKKIVSSYRIFVCEEVVDVIVQRKKGKRYDGKEAVFYHAGLHAWILYKREQEILMTKN